MDVSYRRVSYKRSAQEVHRLTAEAWRTGEPLVSATQGEFRLVVGGSESLGGALGRLVEQDVFDADFGEHPPARMAEEYGPYESEALFVTIVDQDGPVAVARSTWSPTIDQPTKTEVDLGLPLGQLRRMHGVAEHEPVWDATTLAIVPRARACREMLGWLFAELSARCCLSTGAPYMSIMRHEFFRVLSIWIPKIQPLGDLSPFRYLEVWSQPMFSPVGAIFSMTGGFFDVLTNAARSRLAAHGHWGPLIEGGPHVRTVPSSIR